MDYKIIEFKKDRFSIVDKNGNTIDDASGHGFKSKCSAHKFMWYLNNKQDLEDRKIIAEQFINDNPNIKNYAIIFDLDNIIQETKSNPIYNPWKNFLSIIKHKDKHLYAKLCQNLKIKNAIKRLLIDSAGFL